MKNKKVAQAVPQRVTRSVAIDGPNPIDVHVGERVRLRRKFLGKSQVTLAEAIDLTFQQIQKYERGKNRISASKLYEISRFLKTPIGYFFEGYEEQPTESLSESEKAAHGFLVTAEGIELAESFPRVKGPRVRRRLLELVRTIGDEDSDR